MKIICTRVTILYICIVLHQLLQSCICDHARENLKLGKKIRDRSGSPFAANFVSIARSVAKIQLFLYQFDGKSL